MEFQLIYAFTALSQAMKREALVYTVQFQPASHLIVALVANTTKANIAIVSLNPYKNFDVRLTLS